MIATLLLAQILSSAPAPLPAPTRRETQAGGTQTLSDIAGQLDAKRKAGLGKPAFFSATESTAPRQPGLSSAGLLAGSLDYVLGDDGHITLGPATPTYAPTYGMNSWQYGYGGGTRTVIVHEPAHVHASASHATGHAAAREHY
jgi:hypothetical protein